jgi:hypothetical protein
MPDRARPLATFDVRDVIELLGAYTDNQFDVEKLHRWRNPFVYGLEVTQGIQYHRADEHLTNANDRGMDNSIDLAAYKPAWVRSYVRTGALGASAEVSGRLRVERQRLRAFFPMWDEVLQLGPVTPGAVVTQRNPGYAAERGSLGSTLNFIVPAEQVWGVLRLTVELWRTDAPETIVSTYADEVIALQRQTLRLRGVLINYVGPDPTVNAVNPPQINLPAPSVANLRATAAWTLTTMPVEAQGVFSSAGELPWGTPLVGLATQPGGCSVQWLALNAAVAGVRMNDGNRTDVIYYGLLPVGTPIANVGGCESSGVSTGPNFQQVTMAHEVGHGCGLAHAPCNTPGDPSYPAYEPYDPANTPTASLGEYGLDITNGTVHPPTEKDFMSYCGPFVWISLFHHQRLTGNARLNPTTVRAERWKPPMYIHPHLWPWEYLPDPPEWQRGPWEVQRMKAEPVISILGVVEQGELRVTAVTRVAALRQVHGGRASAFVAELVDAEGRVISAAEVMRLPGRGCGCGCSGEDAGDDRSNFVFSALLPDLERGAALRVTSSAEEGEPREVWRVDAPERQVELYGFEVGLEERTGVARWSLEAPERDRLTAALQFSMDDGRSWNSLAVGITADGHEFSVEDLPGGTELVFRLLVHDGFSTVTAETRAASAPRPSQLVIMHPQDGSVLLSGQPLRLWASVEGEAAGEPDRGRWYVDEEQVARGFDDWVVAPAAGEHTVRVECDSDAGTSVAEARFTTVDPE